MLLRMCFATLVISCLGSVAAQYHPPKFIAGGYPSSAIDGGIWLLDGSVPLATLLVPASLSNEHIGCVTMDVDNRDLLVIADGAYGSTATLGDGIFRYDPVTRTCTRLVQTNFARPGPMFDLGSIEVNQDGDYVIGALGLTAPNSSLEPRHVLRYRPGQGITTILQVRKHMPLQYPGKGYGFVYPIGRDIDTGNYLLAAHLWSIAAAHDWRCPVLEVDVNHDGVWSTFNNGGGYYLPGTQTPGCGWPYQSCGSVQQDFATGRLHTRVNNHLYELRKGAHPVSTLWTCRVPSPWYVGAAAPGMWDLQSAAVNRWVAPAVYGLKGPNLPCYVSVDRGTYVVRAFPLHGPNQRFSLRGPTFNAPIFEFYRGRHIASVKIGTAKWQLLFSVPEHSGRAYVAAVGISGIRPPVTLPDGRRIWLRLDPVVHFSMHGMLRPHFDPGPCRLDARGEARGLLDLGRFGKLGGVPVWIALAVLDPQAPLGVAYLPDTYVIRVP